MVPASSAVQPTSRASVYMSAIMSGTFAEWKFQAADSRDSRTVCVHRAPAGPDGTTILDISDPRRPKIVSKLMMSNPQSHSHKVRVIDDLMVVNSEIEPGKGDRLTYSDGGFCIYDIKDKTAPKLLKFVRTHARGVHRFDIDESYAYISTEMDGFVGNILVIYDIRNPTTRLKFALVDARPECACRRAATSERARSFTSPCHAMRRSDVRWLLVLGYFHHRCLRCYAATYTGPPRIRSSPRRADAHFSKGAFRHWRQEYCCINGGGAA